MKTLIATGAALLIAGTASAADVQVAIDPDSEGEIIVRQVEWTPAMDPAFVDVGDDQGMLSADELVEGDDAEAIFGFDPDAVIYIQNDDEDGVRIFEIE